MTAEVRPAGPVTGAGLPPALPALTSVRFFLALGVVLFHLSLAWTIDDVAYTGLIERARLGVDLFFILSGFVLAHVYGESFRTGAYSHGRFLIARFARIYPAHILVLAFMLVIAGAGTLMGEPLDEGRYSGWGFVATVLLVHAWGPFPDIEWNGPSWSLSAEWGAYLLFPAFAWVATALRSRPLALLALSALFFAALDLAFRALSGERLTHAENDLGILRILPEFLAGMALRQLAADYAIPARWSGLSAVLAAFGLATLMHVSAPEPVVVAAGGLLIFTLAQLSKSRAQGWWASPLPLLLGEASYALYLLHLPLLVLWKNAMGVLMHADSSYSMPVWEVLAFLGVAIGGALLITVYWEKPARRLIRRRSGTAATVVAPQGPA